MQAASSKTFDPASLVDHETGELDQLAIRARADVLASRDFGGPNYPPSYFRDNERNVTDLARIMRIRWRRDHGLPDDTVYVTVQVPEWGASGESFAPPDFEIDHKDRDRSNNRFLNLRGATRTQNAANVNMSVANTTGFTGVSLTKSRMKFRAEIRVNKKRIHLGYFDTAEDAFVVRLAAQAEHHGEFSRAPSGDSFGRASR